MESQEYDTKRSTGLENLFLYNLHSNIFIQSKTLEINYTVFYKTIRKLYLKKAYTFLTFM